MEREGEEGGGGGGGGEQIKGVESSNARLNQSTKTGPAEEKNVSTEETVNTENAHN